MNESEESIYMKTKELDFLYKINDLQKTKRYGKGAS